MPGKNNTLLYAIQNQEDIVKIAFVLYDGVTLLDFAGAYDPLTRLKTMGFVPGLEYITCARGEWIQSSEGMMLKPDSVSPDLSGFDYLVIPGGNGVMDQMKDKIFLSWLSVPPGSTVVAAVCGGALIIGAAGLLRNRRATTHPALRGALTNFAREVSGDRIVEDDLVITAGGVTAAIDMGLYLCERIAGREVREKIQKQMDYPYYPKNPGCRTQSTGLSP
jgi:transcriptional regulator GlxA family with amidase domain